MRGHTDGTDDVVRILHVDDDPAFAETAAEFLERKDDRFVVETATAAADGLDRLEAAAFDCVVSDYDMPGRDGIEFLEAVRREHGDLPFVLYTGKGSEEVASEAVSAGVTDYIQKGAGAERYTLLANRIDNAVAARRSAAAAERRRHRLEQILKTVRACVVQLNRDGEFVFANERAVEVLGLERSAVTDRRFDDPEWDIRDVDGDPIPDEELPFRRVLETGEPVRDVRHTIEWNDGTRKLLSVTGAPLFDADGTVESVVFSLSDVTEQRERERELERTRDKFEKVFRRANDAVFIVDPERETFVDCNPAAAELLGTTRERVLSELSPSDCHPAEVATRLETFFADAFAEGDAWTDTVPVVTVDGTVRRVEMSAVRIELDGRDCLVNHVRDVTERRERERRLERTNRRLEAVLETTEAVVCLKDADGRYELLNERAGELFGLESPEAAIGRTIHDLFPPELADRHAADDGRVLANGETITVEREVPGEEGTQTHLVVKSPIRDDEGEPAGVCAVSTDVTERRERRERLRRLRRRLEFALETTDSYVWAVEIESGRTTLHGAVEKLHGVTPAELDDVWTFFDELVHPEDRPKLKRLARAVRDEEQTVFSTDFRTIDGERWLRAEGRRRVVDGTETVIALTTDVTDAKRRERELKRRAERLDEFASVVSHDLRNPLAVASGALEQARADGDDHLGEAADALVRMEELIEDLLALARAGEDLGETTGVSLDDLVRECRRTVATNGATVAVRAERSVAADRSRLRQLFENLLRNAVDHGGDDVAVEVGDLEDGFYVADDGPGIPTEDREAVFEAGRSTDAEGTGFGLNIVHRIADAHGWSVAVVDSEAGGARFEVTGVERPG